jgi:hypothetical protein
MRFREMAALASSHLMNFISASRPQLMFLAISKILAQSGHVFARDSISGTVHRRTFQGKSTEAVDDVRPATASGPLVISLRKGIDLQTLHRDMIVDAMREVCGNSLIIQLSASWSSALQQRD